VPNIREFPTPALDIRPTETGIEAQAGAARRIGAFYNQAGEAISRTGQRLGGAVRDAGDVYVKYQDHKEISAGAANGAAIVNGLTTQWNETVKNANPNDPSVAARFRDETMEPAFQKFQQGFTTERSQQWAEHFVDTYRQHMFVKTSADMSKLAGDAVHINALKSANSFGNTVYIDPSSLDSNRKLARLALDGTVGSSPTIDGVTGAKIRGEMGFKTEQHLVNSAIQGAIRNGGNWQKIANDPKNAPFINQQEIDRYVREEAAQKRAERVDQTYQDHLKKVQEADVSDKTERGYLQKLFSDDPRERASVSVKAIVNDDRLLTNTQLNLRRIIEQETKPAAEARVSNKTTMDMLPDIRSGKITDSDPIYKAFGDGKLTRTDFGFLRKELEDLKTPQGEALSKDRTQFFQKFSPSIDTGRNPNIAGSVTALGQQRMYQAEQDARRQEDVLRRAGKDPHAVYDPRSEFFFGRPDNLKKYQPTLAEINAYEASLSGGKTKITPAPAPPLAPFEPFVKEPPATFNQRFGFDAAATVQQLQPPVEGAQRSPNDGKWYVQKGGKYFRVDQAKEKPGAPPLDHGAHSEWRDGR
jgi:hypothetical protein